MLKFSDILPKAALSKAALSKKLRSLRKFAVEKTADFITIVKMLRQVTPAELKAGFSAKGAHARRRSKSKSRLFITGGIGLAAGLSIVILIIGIGGAGHSDSSVSSPQSAASNHGLSGSRDPSNRTQANHPTSTGHSSHSGNSSANLSPQSELLELSSFPKGWSSSPYTGAPGGGGTGLEGPSGASCLGVSATTLDLTPPSANSAYFGQANSGVQVQETVEVFSNTTAAHTDFLTFDSPKAPNCMATILGANFQQEIKAVLPSGTSVGTVKAAIVPIGRFATRLRNVSSHAIQMTFPLEQNGKASAMYLDIMMVQSGRSEATVDITDLNSPPSESLLKFVASRTANRLQ